MAIFNLAGHNNNDSGAPGVNGRQENIETIAFRNLVSKYIDKSKYVEIQDRNDESLAIMVKRLKPGSGSVCVEWHFDSADTESATGTSAFIDEEATHASKLFAIELTNVVSEILGIKNRGVLDSSQSHRGRLAMPKMVGTTCLLEICFISNPSDMAKYDENKVALAKSIAEILEKYDDFIK